MNETETKVETIKRRLDQLLAQNLSEMGYQARVRQQQRIEALESLCAEHQTETREAVISSTPPDAPARPFCP